LQKNRGCRNLTLLFCNTLKIFSLQKHCSKCGAAFGCKNDARGCWCESLQVTTETLVQLKETYANCLCLSCLEVYALQTGPGVQQAFERQKTRPGLQDDLPDTRD
jgi:hypothetical protein